MCCGPPLQKLQGFMPPNQNLKMNLKEIYLEKFDVDFRLNQRRNAIQNKMHGRGGSWLDSKVSLKPTVKRLIDISNLSLKMSFRLFTHSKKFTQEIK